MNRKVHLTKHGRRPTPSRSARRQRNQIPKGFQIENSKVVEVSHRRRKDR